MRDLVNHVVVGTRWVALLLAGRGHDEVTGLDGDLLGSDPARAFSIASTEALAAFDRPGAADATMHASHGTFPGVDWWVRRALDGARWLR